MLLKISFKGETHIMKLKQHTTFNDLQHHVAKVFKKLPSKYGFVYTDEEGDQINLDNQNDLINMLSSEMKKVNIKIVTDESQNNQDGSIIKEFQSPKLEIQSFTGEDESKDQIFSQASSKIKFQKSQSNVSDVIYIKNQKPIQPIQIKQPKQVKQNKQILNQKIKIQNQNQPKPKLIPQIKQVPQIQLKKSPKNIHHDIKCDLCDMYPIIGIRYKCNICYDFDLCENCQSIYDHQHSMLKIKYNNQQYQRKDKTSVVQILGTNVLYGANKIKQGFKTAVTTITRKMSGNSQKNEKKQQYHTQFKHQLKDNALAALDKLKVRQQKQEQKPKPRKPIFKSQQDKRIQAANYLSLILGVDFSRSYAFVKKHQGVQKQQLIVKYFQNQKAM